MKIPDDPVFVYRLYGDIVYGFSKEFTSDEHTAGSILKNTIECLTAGNLGFEPSNMSFLTYIRTVVRQKSIESVKSPLYATLNSSARPESSFLQVVASISPLHSRLFNERYYEGKTEALIAADSGLQIADVRVKIKKIVKKIGTDLK